MSLRPTLFLFLTAFFFAVSPQVQADSSKYGGQLVISTTSDPKSFNTIIAKETSTTEIMGYLFEGLTTLNPFTLKVEPLLAKSWSVSEDGLTWTFFLREDVVWHDGVPFTADDVVFTFNDLIFNPNIPSSSRDVFTIDGKPFEVKKIAPHAVEFILPVKFAPFLRAMSQEILPKHILKASVDAGNFNFTWGIDTPPEKIIGTGSFKLVKYDPGQRLIFHRNERYWKKSAEGDALPYLDEIVYLILQNADVEMLKFLEGALDIQSLRGMDYSLLKPMEKKRNFTVYDLGAAMGSNFITFNQNPGVNPNSNQPFVDPVKLKWFTDLNFRRAIAYAVDKDKIIEIVKNKLGYPQYSPIGPGAGFFHNENVKHYDYDLNKARQILEQAGYIDRDGDGYREDKEGHKIEFNLITNAGATERLDIASIVNADLKAIGMKVNFKSVEFNTLVKQLTATYDWDAIVLGLTGGTEPHFGKNVWDSSGQLHMWNPRQETPQTEWEARINELYSQGVQELNEDKRKVFYDEFQEIVAEQLPVIYTVLSAKIVAVRNRLGNLKPSNYGGVLHNVEEIFIVK